VAIRFGAWGGGRGGKTRPPAKARCRAARRGRNNVSYTVPAETESLPTARGPGLHLLFPAKSAAALVCGRSERKPGPAELVATNEVGPKSLGPSRILGLPKSGQGLPVRRRRTAGRRPPIDGYKADRPSRPRTGLEARGLLAIGPEAGTRDRFSRGGWVTRHHIWASAMFAPRCGTTASTGSRHANPRPQ